MIKFHIYKLRDTLNLHTLYIIYIIFQVKHPVWVVLSIKLTEMYNASKSTRFLKLVKFDELCICSPHEHIRSKKMETLQI